VSKTNRIENDHALTSAEIVLLAEKLASAAFVKSVASYYHILREVDRVISAEIRRLHEG